jgi:hypothetical protein
MRGMAPGSAKLACGLSGENHAGDWRRTMRNGTASGGDEPAGPA